VNDSAPARPSIVIRRPRLDFEGGVARYYLHGNPLPTHLLNSLNLLFPDGERFFVRSVRDQMHRIKDPELLESIKSFSGQEGMHAREYERFIDVLERQGYRVRAWVQRFRRFNTRLNRLPAPLRLALTAAAEHYTATLGSLALELGVLEDADPTMRQLMVWHAIEEIEHKSVAYDVLQATYPSYLLRLLGFVCATLNIGVWGLGGMRMLLRQDALSREQMRAYHRQYRPLRKLWTRSMVRALGAYLRPGFHPCDIDDRHLIAKHLQALPPLEPTRSGV